MSSTLNFFFLSIVIFSLSSCNQSSLLPSHSVEDMRGNTINLGSSQYTLVLRSAIGCPPCKKGMLDVLENIDCEKVEVLVIEEGGYEESVIKEYYSELFSQMTFIDRKEFNSKYISIKLFPQYFLYKSNKLIWRGKGANELDIELINSLADCP